MAVRYVDGIDGNDANDGLAAYTGGGHGPKFTLNGCENTPVVAGDFCWVRPTVYREMLTCDVSGAAGSPITYCGDVAGEIWGVGGVVRITGSDNDQTATRVSCITSTAQRNYRTFRGFVFDMTSSHIIVGSTVGSAGTNWIIEDCLFENGVGSATSIYCSGANQLAWTIRRCCFLHNYNGSVFVDFTNTVAVDNTGHIIEDCIGIGGFGFRSTRVGGITVRNCTVILGGRAVYVSSALTVGQTIIVNNCILFGNSSALTATVLGELIEDYNSLFANATPRINVAVGANSNAYPPLFDYGILHAGASQVSGFRFPSPIFGALSQWSQIRAIADTGAATEDIHGLSRPVTAGKRSWGAVQYVDMARDTGTVRTGTASKKLADAGRDQIYVPTTNVSTVFSIYVYREANYAGVNPQMIIKQPGQADTVVTDAGAAGAWNQLTTTLTPAALPGYVVIELVSNNTAAAGNYGVYFDDLTVT